jgi:hypothetical protein
MRSPWRKKMWCVPELNEELIERPEDVLKLLAKPFDWKEPVVALDERPVRLLDPERTSAAAELGHRSKHRGDVSAQKWQ